MVSGATVVPNSYLTALQVNAEEQQHMVSAPGFARVMRGSITDEA